MQEAWNHRADPTKFHFIILEWGPHWSDRKVRKAKELAFIQAHANFCFNTLPGQQPSKAIIRPIMLDGQRFESTREAAHKLNRARTSILRDLRDSKKPDCYYLEPENFGTIPVFAQIGKDGKEGPVFLFSSMTAVVEAGFASSQQMIRRRIKSPGFPNWCYAAVDLSGKPIRKSYFLKSGERAYEHSLANQELEKQSKT